jgi:hypothetical protein
MIVADGHFPFLIVSHWCRLEERSVPGGHSWFVAPNALLYHAGALQK